MQKISILRRRTRSLFFLLIATSAFGVGCAPQKDDDSKTVNENSSDEEDDDTFNNNETDNKVETDSEKESDIKIETDSEKGSDIEIETDSEKGSDIEIETDFDTGADGGDNTDTDTAPRLINLTTGYGVIADFTTDTQGVSLQLGTEFATALARRVTCISQEELISFVENNSHLFTSEELETIAGRQSYTERGYGADLLTEIVSIKLTDDFNQFSDDGKEFIDAIRSLVEKEYTMTGTTTAVGLSLIPTSPKYWAKVTKLNFSDGFSVRSVNTHIIVTDESGSQDRIIEKPGEAPLNLVASEKMEDTFDLLHGYGTVYKSDTSIVEEEETTMSVNTSVKVVPHVDLVDFVETNQFLFSDEQYNILKQHSSYTDSSRAPSLLLGLLGLKLGGSFNYFSNGAQIEVSPFDEEDAIFIQALSSLTDKDMTLSGNCTAVGNFGVATQPYVFVDVLKVTFPDGNTFRTIDTNPVVADKSGDQDLVTGISGQPPLSLD